MCEIIVRKGDLDGHTRCHVHDASGEDIVTEEDRAAFQTEPLLIDGDCKTKIRRENRTSEVKLTDGSDVIRSGDT